MMKKYSRPAESPLTSVGDPVNLSNEQAKASVTHVGSANTAGLKPPIDVAMHPAGNEFAIAWYSYDSKLFVKKFDFNTGAAIGNEVEVDATEAECLILNRPDGCLCYAGYPSVTYYNNTAVMLAYGGSLWHEGSFAFLKVVDPVSDVMSDRVQVGPTNNKSSHHGHCK